MALADVEKSLKLFFEETLFAGIMAVGGGALAFYTDQNSTNQIWPLAYTVVSTIGTCTIVRNVYNVRRSAWYKYPYEFFPMNMATGTIIYFSSLYAFSESWKCDSLLWIPCLGIAAGGLYFAHSSIYRPKYVFELNPLLKCCELAFIPALIGLGATYLWYFQNHDEEWLQWLPLVLIFFNSGWDITIGTRIEPWEEEPKLLLLKGIHLLMGGCLRFVSSAVMGVYFSIKEYHWIFRVLMTSESFWNFEHISSAISCLEEYIGMEEGVLRYLAGLPTGFAMVMSSGLMVPYMGNMTKYLFPILSTSGYCILWGSAYNLSKVVSRPVISKYSQRRLASLLIIGSTAALAYVANHMGWRYSLMMLPLPFAGIYVTNKCFRRW